jgi:dTMP kinase
MSLPRAAVIGADPRLFLRLALPCFGGVALWAAAGDRRSVSRYARRVLIAIEGVDGAGKHTLTQGLRAQFEAAGKSVTSLAFPRYHRSVTADLAAEALHGGHGDLSSSVYAMAVLFALDRADARGEIERLRAEHDVVILDRYVASNAAYSAARLHQGIDGEVVAWVHELEFDRFGAPAPDWQVLLAVPTELAAQRAQRRADTDADRARDAYERDDGLQRRTNEAYAGLAATDWGGRWAVAGPDVDPGELARTLAR